MSQKNRHEVSHITSRASRIAVLRRQFRVTPCCVSYALLRYGTVPNNVLPWCLCAILCCVTTFRLSPCCVMIFAIRCVLLPSALSRYLYRSFPTLLLTCVTFVVLHFLSHNASSFYVVLCCVMSRVTPFLFAPHYSVLRYRCPYTCCVPLRSVTLRNVGYVTQKNVSLTNALPHLPPLPPSPRSCPSAFAYYPSGEIVHYYCYKDPTLPLDKDQRASPVPDTSGYRRL